MTAPLFLCPECLAPVAETRVCDCGEGGRTIAGAPGERPAMLGHLALLSDAPRPWRLLEDLCDGPRLYPRHIPSESRNAARRHLSRTLWLWQRDFESLPELDRLGQSGSGPERLLKLLAATPFLLLDVPQATALFTARYARKQPRGSRPPAFDGLIDRLQALWDFGVRRPAAIALFDPGGFAGAELRDRLRSTSACECMSNYKDALAWLLRRLPSTPAVREGIPSRPAQARSPAKTTLGLDSRREVVRIADIGGSSGRHLLARLHQHTLDSAEARPADACVRLISSGMRLWTSPTGEGLHCGRVQRLRQAAPPSDDSLPAWEGFAQSMWGARRPFSVALEGPSPSDGTGVLIVGVGPSRLFGENDLAGLLERVWFSGRIPAALIRHVEVNPDLLRWTRREFGRVPEFSDTWDGNIGALGRALRLSHQMAES